MSPRKIKAEQKPEVVDDSRVIVTTSLGVHIECHPVITEMEVLEENIRAQFEWPDVPERDISNTVPPDAGPEWPRSLVLTQELVDKSGTDDEKVIWAEYLAAHGAVDTEYGAKLMDGRVRLFCLRGITVLDQKPEEEWVEEHEFMGMVVPEGRLERKLHYFRTEVLGTATDMFVITKGIYQAAGVDKEALDEYEATFRGEMGRAVGEAFGSDKEATEPEEPEAEEGVVG